MRPGSAQARARIAARAVRDVWSCAPPQSRLWMYSQSAAGPVSLVILDWRVTSTWRVLSGALLIRPDRAYAFTQHRNLAALGGQVTETEWLLGYRSVDFSSAKPTVTRYSRKSSKRSTSLGMSVARCCAHSIAHWNGSRVPVGYRVGAAPRDRHAQRCRALRRLPRIPRNGRLR